MSRSKSETAIFSIFLQFFDRIRAVKIGLWDDKMKVGLIRLKNRSKLRFRHTFREKFGVLGLKMVEIGQKSLFLVISDCFLAVSDRKSHKISFSLAKIESRAHFKIEKRVLRFVSENRFLVIWGLLSRIIRVILCLIRMEPVLIEPVKSQHNQFLYGNEIQIPSFCVFELGLEFWHVWVWNS